MTISKTSKIFTLALVSFVLAGCGGSGGGSSSNASFPHGIYVGTFADTMVHQFGEMDGSSTQQFSIPGGDHAKCTAFDAQGQMYIGGTGKIYKYSKATGSQPTIFGSQGSGVGHFGSIRSIAFDSQGRIYIVDQDNKRVVRMDNITGSGWTELDLSPHIPSNVFSAMSLALDSQGRIYISLWTTDKILRFDSMSDTVPKSFGTHGSGIKNLYGPACVHVDKNNLIYIADQTNHRIVRISDMTGSDWTEYGTMGSGIGQFLAPVGVTTDNAGRIFVIDYAAERIVRIDNMNGTGWVTLGDGAGQEQLVSQPVSILVR